MGALQNQHHPGKEPEHFNLLFQQGLSDMGLELKPDSEKSILFFRYPDPGDTGFNCRLLKNLNQLENACFMSMSVENRVWIYLSAKSDGRNDPGELLEAIRKEIRRMIRSEVMVYAFR